MPSFSPDRALRLPAGSQLFVQGGRNNFVLEDMFVLDLLRKEWTEALPGAKGPPARHGHLLTVHGDHLYLYGGYDELGAYSDSVFRLPVPYGQAFTAARWASWGLNRASLSAGVPCMKVVGASSIAFVCQRPGDVDHPGLWLGLQPEGVSTRCSAELAVQSWRLITAQQTACSRLTWSVDAAPYLCVHSAPQGWGTAWLPAVVCP